MDPTTGLLPGQSWSVAPSATWQARIGRDGRAHCIGLSLALHADYAAGYTDMGTWYDHNRVYGAAARLSPQYRRPWHTFERARRAARMHERIVIAVRRQEQGGAA